MTHIIGNGLIATNCRQHIADSQSLTIFACGASNNSAMDKGERLREQTLLESTLATLPVENTFVYFGTCSIFDPTESGSAYCEHKLHMEELIYKRAKRYFILRLPQVVGHHGNPDNLINFLTNKIKHNLEFDLWENAYRTVLDVSDISRSINFLAGNSNSLKVTINVAPCQPVPVTTIVDILEELLGKKARYHKISKGAYYSIDTGSFTQHLSNLFDVRNTAYLRQTLASYLAKQVR